LPNGVKVMRENPNTWRSTLDNDVAKVNSLFSHRPVSRAGQALRAHPCAGGYKGAGQTLHVVVCVGDQRRQGFLPNLTDASLSLINWGADTGRSGGDMEASIAATKGVRCADSAGSMSQYTIVKLSPLMECTAVRAHRRLFTFIYTF
jgi:hypothetical protein